MEKSTGLFITSLFIIHSSCLRPLWLSFTQLHHHSLLPLPSLFIPHFISPSLSTFLCHLWANSLLFPPSSHRHPSVLHHLCISPPDSHVCQCRLVVLCPLCTFVSILSAAGRCMEGCIDGWMNGWVDVERKGGREEWQNVCSCNGY